MKDTCQVKLEETHLVVIKDYAMIFLIRMLVATNMYKCWMFSCSCYQCWWVVCKGAYFCFVAY